MPLTRSLPLLAAFGALANSLRSNNASALIRTLLRCSARPNGGFEYLTARPLRELRPNGLLASLTSRGLGLPHSSRLTSLKGTARRATTPSPLIPHPSLLVMGNHKGCPYDLTPHSYDLIPTTSLLRPHSYDLTPHSSLLTPHSSFRAGRSKRERLAEYGNFHHPSQVKLVCIKEPQHGIGPVNGFGPFGGSGAVGWVQQVLLALLQKGF